MTKRTLRAPDMFYIMKQMNEPLPSLGDFEIAVLIALAVLPQAYGASIRREVSERLGRDCSVGAVYTTLQRLEDKRVIRSRTSEPSPVRGGRARRCYEFTPMGTRALKAARAARERLWKSVRLRERPT